MMNIMMKIMISYPKSHRSWGVQNLHPFKRGHRVPGWSTEPLHREDLNKPPQKRSWSHWRWLRWYLRSPALGPLQAPEAPVSRRWCFNSDSRTARRNRCFNAMVPVIYTYVYIYIFFTRLHLSTTNCKSAYLLYCLCICALYTCSSVSLYPSPSMTKYHHPLPRH